MDDPFRHHKEAAAIQNDVVLGSIGCLGILGTTTGMAIAALWNLWAGIAFILGALAFLARLLRSRSH